LHDSHSFPTAIHSIIQAIQSAALFEQMFLASLAHSVPVASVEAPPVPQFTVENKVNMICRTKGIVPAPTGDNLHDIAVRWKDSGVLEIRNSPVVGNSAYVLSIAADDIIFALRDHPAFGAFLQTR
jgi:hypothetical protein